MVDRDTSGRQMASAAAHAMDDKKAEDIQILALAGVMVDADYFVIGSCASLVQLQAITQSVLDALDEMGVPLRRQEGRRDNHWVLLDYGDLVVHLFLHEERQYYNLEKLWADAKRIPFDRVSEEDDQE